MADSHGSGRDRTGEEETTQRPATESGSVAPGDGFGQTSAPEEAPSDGSGQATESVQSAPGDGSGRAAPVATSTDGEDPGEAPTGRRLDWRKFREVPPAVVLLVFMLYFYFTLDDQISGRRGQTFIDPDFWPGVLLGLGIVLSIIYLIKAILWGLRSQKESAQKAPVSTRLRIPDEGGTGDGAQPADSLATTRRVGALVVATLLLGGYIYVMSTVGFIPATLVFSVLFLLLAGERRWWLIAGLPPLIVVVVVAVFTRVLVVPLPRGTGFFLELSTWFY